MRGPGREGGVMGRSFTLSNCFRISRGYALVRIWWFNRETRRVMGRTVIKPDNGLSRRERYDEIARALKDAQLTAPDYKPTKAEKIPTTRADVRAGQVEGGAL